MTELAGVWLRVSTGKQDEQSQVPDVTAWCESHDYDVARTYTLHGKSAFKGQQAEQLSTMLDDMRAGAIRVLVVWKSDRIERRGPRYAFNLIEDVRQAGGRIEFVTEPYLNVSGPAADLMVANMSVMAREESRTKSDRVKAKHAALREAGSLVGRPPWGYVSTGTGEIEPTEEARRLVPEVFARCIKGDSLGAVAAWLTEQTGRAWWPGRVGHMIRCTTYMGHRRDGNGRTILRCEPLVDAATFRRAGEALDGRPKRGPVKPEGRAMLATAIFCPRCEGDSPMYRVMSRRGQRRVPFYRCAGRGAARKGCGNLVPCEVADAAVDKIARATFKVTPVMVRKLTPGHNHEAELEAVRFEMKQLAARDLPDDEYDAELTRLRAERDRLAALPSVPDKVEDVPTGQNYWQLWKDLSTAERGPFLVKHGFRVEATREAVKLSQPGHPRNLTATWTLDKVQS